MTRTSESTKPAPHIGQILKTYLDSKRKSARVLAGKLGIKISCVYVYFTRPSMQVAQLWKISNELGHNFFKDIGEKLPDSFTTNVKPSTEKEDLLQERDILLRAKDEQIATLQKEIERLVMERDILRDVMKLKA